MDLLTQITANVSPGVDYEADPGDALLHSSQDPLVRLIAFYLPQFHPIAENDRAWGKGFTEWTNVSKAIPRFAGHLQPRLPGELGFYDLRLKDTLQQQATLARRFGIHGFCFHYYWFSGKRLLETPLEILAANADIQIPFCVSWANHSWNRNWDGGNNGLILEQLYSPVDDLAFIQSLERLMRDERYIRINGRPLLLVYKPKSLPDPIATVGRWRKYLTDAGVGNPYVVKCHLDDYVDPAAFGMDAAAGFPPAPSGWWLPEIGGPVSEKLDPAFNGRVKSYEMMANTFCALPPQPHTFFHGLCPGFDNEPRQPAYGTCFAGSSPRSYGTWLERVCSRTVDEHVGDERLVFINAWNEWGEGAYLEPDRHNGYAFLAATARALLRLKRRGSVGERGKVGRLELNRVYTIHGTVLYCNEATSELLHGPIIGSPANVFLISEGNGAKLIHMKNNLGVREAVAFSYQVGHASLSQAAGVSSEGTTMFEVVEIDSNLKALKARDQFLSAERDGKIQLDRSHCFAWEHFYILPDPAASIQY